MGETAGAGSGSKCRMHIFFAHFCCSRMFGMGRFSPNALDDLRLPGFSAHPKPMGDL
jgi:hypothetical protein